jgi:hypothetical protein
MPRSYKEDNWGDQISSVRESVKRIRGREAKEFLLLEAVSRERLVKTAGLKRLSECCGAL